MTRSRIFIAIVVPVWSYFMRWLVVSWGRKVFPTAFRIAVGVFNAGRAFRMLGSDLAKASVGLFVAASVNDGSNLRVFLKGAGEFDYLEAMVCGVLFGILYATAMFIRYAIIDAVESLDDQPIHRIFWSHCLWFVGLLLLWSTSWLAVRAA